jgi:hypothetical protein
MGQVKKGQIEQIEHIGAENITDGQAGRTDQSHRTYAIEKLGQRGQHGDEDKAYPDATKASFLSNYVTISSNFPTRDENDHNTDDKFNPDQAMSPLSIPLY